MSRHVVFFVICPLFRTIRTSLQLFFYIWLHNFCLFYIFVHVVISISVYLFGNIVVYLIVEI